MKTRKVNWNISFPIPDALPRWHELKQYIATVKFWFSPYRCVDTGERLDFGHTLVEWRGTGLERVMIQVYEPLSRTAMVERTKQLFASGGKDGYDDRREVMVKQCDCCRNTDRPTIGMGSGNFDFRLGMRWWNGFRICEECMIATIEKGELKSDVLSYVGGKIYYRNGKGALIKPKGQTTDQHNIQSQPYPTLAW